MPGGKIHARDSAFLAAVVTPVAAVTVGMAEGLIIGAGVLLGIPISPDLDLLETQSPLWQEIASTIIWFATTAIAVALLWAEIWR